MTEKVKVFRGVAEAIEYLLSHEHYEYTKEKLLATHAKMEKYPKRTWLDVASPLNDIDLLTLAEILVKGYEVEMTPHERIHEIYKEAYEGAHGAEDIRFHKGVAEGVYQTLKALNEKVEGIYMEVRS